MPLGLVHKHGSHAIELHLKTCDQCRAFLQTAWRVEDQLLQSLRQNQAAANAETPGRCDTDTASELAELGTGNHPQFVRDYRILKPLEQGGRGAVYLAQNERLGGGHKVALKLIKTDRMHDDKMMARFHRETRAMGSFNHQNLVAAIDAGDHDGRLYLVMEYVDGSNLASIVHRLQRLSIADACEAIRQAACGLQHAIEKLDDFVHRDIKPSNLLVGKDGIVKITDLGLVRAGSLFEDDAALTASSSFMGTLDFVAPEQIDRGQEVDIRADIYALGATLYKLLSGEAPFSESQVGSFSKRIYAISNLSAKPLRELRSDVPDSLSKLVERLLAKDPAERPSSPNEVAIALEPYCQDADLAALVLAEATNPVNKPVQPEVEPSSKGSLRKNRVLIGSAFAIPLLILAGILITLSTGNGELIIDLPDDADVKLNVSRIGDRVRVIEGYQLAQGKNKWTLKTGKYVVELAGPDAARLELRNCPKIDSAFASLGRWLNMVKKFLSQGVRHGWLFVRN